MYIDFEAGSKTFSKAVLGFSLIVYLLLLIKTAWLCDDAYITFRTVDNFINGYGLRWNVVERVQTYTHPLWMFLVSVVYFFTREVFFTSILLSIIISLITAYLLIFQLAKNFYNAVLIIFPILLSKSFIDFSTSGLENSLSHLLFIILSIVYLREEKLTKRKFILGSLSSLILLNRYDYILILLPILIFELKKASKKELKIFFLGFSPVIIWIIFSLWYYGFPFPNTGYAKLNTGIDRILLVREGLYYFKESFAVDPLTFITILISFLLVIINKEKKLLLISLGTLIYFGYIVFVGGDFMAGRFFTVPFVLSLVVLSQIQLRKICTLLMVVLVIILLGVVSLYRTIFNESIEFWKQIIRFDSISIMDERKFYYNGSNLIDTFKGKKMPTFHWVIDGKEMRKSEHKFFSTFNIGFQGYYAGPEIYILDKFALSDPLLSRLPSKKGWWIGHFARAIPEGYPESILTNTNKIVDKDLHLYYEKLRKVTRGDLFDFKRLIEVINLNLGKYDYLIERYTSKIKNLDQVN